MRDLGRVALLVLLAGRVVWHAVMRNRSPQTSRRQRVVQNAGHGGDGRRPRLLLVGRGPSAAVRRFDDLQPAERPLNPRRLVQHALAVGGVAVFLAAAAGLASGCSQSQPPCSLSASDIICQGETFDACAVAGCPIGYFNCPDPPVGCRIAPGMVLAHHLEKPPNDFYLCGDPLSMCGTWTEASCQVTVTTSAYVSTTYTIHDSTCP